ncbi:hypothetical protein NL676_008733 [Syzygium grande]|nr:hypothetical protein NL676_008733 [Syzygium grande]
MNKADVKEAAAAEQQAKRKKTASKESGRKEATKKKTASDGGGNGLASGWKQRRQLAGTGAALAVDTIGCPLTATSLAARKLVARRRYEVGR